MCDQIALNIRQVLATSLVLIAAACAADEVDYSTWMYMKDQDWNSTSYTRENWLDPENPSAAAVSIANSTKRQFYANLSISTPSATSTFPMDASLAVGSGATFWLSQYNAVHTINDLTLLNGSVIKQSAYGITHKGSTRVCGTATYAFGLYSNNSTWTVNSSFASDSDAVLNTKYGAARTKTEAMLQTIKFSGSWSEYAGTLNFGKGMYFLLTSAVSPFGGTICIQSNAFVKAEAKSGTFTVPTLRLEDGGTLMFNVASGATVQYVVDKKLEIVGSPEIDLTFPAGTYDHFDLIKLTGDAAKAENLPDISGLKVSTDSFVGILPANASFSLIDGDAEGEKVLRLSWTAFKAMTTANDYSKNDLKSAFFRGNATYAANDGYWTPSGVPAEDEECVARVDATLAAYTYGSLDFHNLTLCMRDKTFMNNASTILLKAIYFEGTCPLSGSGHGGVGQKTISGEVYINGTLDMGGWGGPVRAIYGGIHGSGLLRASHASDRGIRIRDVNQSTDFSGQYFFFGPSAQYATKPSKTITLDQGFGFDGAYSGSAPAWQSVIISNAYVECGADITIDEPTRGLYVYGGSNFEVPKSCTLAINDALTVEGDLVKWGPGALVLGNSSLKFAVAGKQQDDPAATGNTLVITQGTLKVTSPQAINGLRLGFAADTTWSLPLTGISADMQAKGAINIKVDAPFATAATDGKFKLVPTDYDTLGHDAAAIAICTVSADAPAMTFDYPAKLGKRAVSVTSRDNGDNTVTYVLNVAAKPGMIIFCR